MGCPVRNQISHITLSWAFFYFYFFYSCLFFSSRVSGRQTGLAASYCDIKYFGLHSLKLKRYRPLDTAVQFKGDLELLVPPSRQ